MEKSEIETISPQNNNKSMLIDLFNKHMTIIIIAIIFIIVLVVGGFIAAMFINSRKKNKTKKNNDKQHQDLNEDIDGLHNQLETGEYEEEHENTGEGLESMPDDSNMMS